MKSETNILSAKTTRKRGALFFLLFALILSSGCRPTRKLAANELLLENVEIHNFKETGIPKENFEAYVRQKPNRKFLHKFHYFVWWYNLFDQDKINERKIKRNIKFDKKNQKRIKRSETKNAKRAKKGKPTKSPKLKDKDSPILTESVRDIGEPAVVFDSVLALQTRLQLSRYLFSKGYFNNTVSDSIRVLKDEKRVLVNYYLHPGKPYYIRNVNYDIPDKKLANLIFSQIDKSIISRGMQYDAEKLQAERVRLTEQALNNGFFYFENAYINFGIDSTVGDKALDITMKVKNYSVNSPGRDSLIRIDHPQLTIDQVYVITEPAIGNPRDLYFKDTITSRRRKIKFLHNEPMAYRLRILTTNVDIYPGQLYRKDTTTQTYKQLLGLGLFKSVTIRYLPSETKKNALDCFILCNPAYKQAITVETEGTNTAANLGIDGNILYQNRNSFRGGELIEAKLQAAVVAQHQLNTTGVEDYDALQKTFNTIQIGPELKFSVPRALFPFSYLPFRKDQLPRTYVKTSLNYQTRPEFNRVITNLEYGFTFRTKFLRHEVIPFEIYMVRAKLDPTFEKDLKTYNDAFLLNSFQDHITTLARYVVTYASKENAATGKRTAYYARLNLQSSGNLLRALYSASGQQPDSLDRYLMFGIPFAQFLKSDLDFRIYVPVRKRSRIVYRIAGGIGKPLANLSGLPYEQSFFSGGPNSVRAWRARTLGPGGYDPRDSPARYDKIGDILMEGNVEYRFHMIRNFYGALFADAGNIWRLEPDDSKPNGQFHFKTFADQIAIGGGLGIRWDLSFFVLRLDMAMPLKDPKFPAGNRWVLDKQPWQYSVANFGIGYPF